VQPQPGLNVSESVKNYLRVARHIEPVAVARFYVSIVLCRHWADTGGEINLRMT
jgi:hypothetical protein